MQQFVVKAVFLSLVAASSSFAASPFVGRWDFNLTTQGGNRAAWLGVKDAGGTLEVWYQPTGDGRPTAMQLRHRRG